MPATVVLGVGAGIAAYKAAYLLRDLSKRGFDVHVVPTPASLAFVGTATWQALSQHPVHTGVFDTGDADHVELARRADLIVISPATADLIARLRIGAADDLLTTTVLASSCPVLLAPAMHTAMWANPATQDNIKQLRQRGIHILDPEVGALGSGDVGKGRMVEPHVIAEAAASILKCSHVSPNDGSQGFDVSTPRLGAPLDGQRLLVTAGGTREAIDPVRFIGNTSSGRQGCAIAQAGLEMGASVTLITANISPALLPVPQERLTIIEAVTAADVERETLSRLDGHDVLIMAAAVADFRPSVVAASKIKKDPATLDAPTIVLERTTDILAAATTHPHRPPVIVGFAAETGDAETVRALGADKARRKGADLLAVNRVGDGHGFGDVPNSVDLLNAQGEYVDHIEGEKELVARALLEHVATLLGTIAR
ncbi:bifunctional phosphopantothenoylcysteine decarboxylase/phosphopantothenate--cysteine ligase CoaBC [Schaalia suimastitidis]|uniref:bifunctional phosphopantothenoylcysteine decarboxylase/phosphopantothenate--cysteine ligase CoaBC n=1 Tax=Schaalia suimastitidis TaxID=121163 RepID=UPI00040CB513|nr:bifunctional phosphopantothenoylcysteine decarboxylase/phosphopantothenate--cysteine ligase CoaBC [Schaalia suimastitidis]